MTAAMIAAVLIVWVCVAVPVGLLVGLALRRAEDRRTSPCETAAEDARFEELFGE